MKQHYVNEIQVMYKPRLDLKNLQKITTDKEIAMFLQTI